MITREANAESGTVTVTFVTTDHHHGPLSLVGDFNGWDHAATPMVETGANGELSATVTLEAGRRHHFRYLGDGDRWFNDEAADDYVPNDFGGHDSVVDLTEFPTRASGASGKDTARTTEDVPEAEVPATRKRRTRTADSVNAGNR